LTNGEFQSPNLNENKLNNALKRISLGVELLQTFLSENIFKTFNERKTFMLRTDLSDEHKNVCETFYSTKISMAKALNMSQSELFITLAEEIKETVRAVIVEINANGKRDFGKVMKMSMETTLRLPGRSDISRSEHNEILTAIENGNGELASRLTLQHITGARATALADAKKKASN
jgi:hypothetical protein